MIVIWQEYASFQISQRFADQVIIIWFSDFEILKIHLRMITEQFHNNVPVTSNIIKQKQPNRNERPTSENGNAKQPNNAQPNNPKEKNYHKNKR